MTPQLSLPLGVLLAIAARAYDFATVLAVAPKRPELRAA
jgi:hypothetical protein